MEALKSSITRFGSPRKEMGFCKNQRHPKTRMVADMLVDTTRVISVPKSRDRKGANAGMLVNNTITSARSSDFDEWPLVQAG